MKVLVVEDDGALRDLWLTVFAGAGHEAVGTPEVGDARRLLLSRRFDVVILDLNLGKESGLSVAMTATYANPDCKVVMITGSTLFARGELFEMAPSLATVLRKPVAIDELLAVSEHGTAAH